MMTAQIMKPVLKPASGRRLDDSSAAGDIALDSDRYDFAVRVEFEDRRPVARDVLTLEGNKREPEGPTERDPSARNFSR